MICFDVYENGEKLCRAGKADLLVLSSILSWVKKTEVVDEELTLHIGGLYKHESGGNAHPQWLERLELNVGDEITIKIVEADTADEPVGETVNTPEWIQEQKRRYFESVKAEFEKDNSNS
jgi:hypothetical protein